MLLLFVEHDLVSCGQNVASILGAFVGNETFVEQAVSLLNYVAFSYETVLTLRQCGRF